MVGYFGIKGTHLNIESNLNQPINGVRPYTALSVSSPIDAGKPLGNITLTLGDHQRVCTVSYTPEGCGAAGAVGSGRCPVRAGD